MKSESPFWLLDSDIDGIVAFRSSLKVLKADICQDFGDFVCRQDLHCVYLLCPVTHGLTGVEGVILIKSPYMARLASRQAFLTKLNNAAF